MEAQLSTLNREQRIAVETPPGPMLILAGAGSGKTRVLTHRIAYLIHARGIRPWNILAVTFTNKAAGEMAARVRVLLPHEHDAVHVHTFHSFCARLLRRYIERLGYAPNFVIYNDADQIGLLKRVGDEMTLKERDFEPRYVRTLIDQAKNRLLWPSQVKPEALRAPTFFPDVYERYQKRLKAANALDFGDLLLLTVKLLEEHDAVRSEFRERYHHLLIDEYQDTNHAQYRLAQLWTHEQYRSICVVGDEDQSIYGFRGADISNILNFSKDFPDATVIKLEQNYRSSERILNAAAAIVAHNAARIGKTLWTERGEGEKLRYIESENEIDEAFRVAEEIRKLRSTLHIPYGDMAVFYRANAQSRVFEEVFNQQQLPYLLIGQGFYDRKEIRDLRAYLQLLFNPLDDASLDRILNEPPRGIGAKARSHLFEEAGIHECSCYVMLTRMAHDPATTSAYTPKLLAFYRMMESIRTAAATLTVREVIERVLDDTGYRERLTQQNDVEAVGRLENLKELITVASEFDDLVGMDGLQSFLERISLHSQADEITEGPGRVTLMTLHNAKGLEFPVVFIVGLEDGLFPHSRTVDNPEELEEERRLCYVGLTRAMSRLYLLRARWRRIQGENRAARPSRFLREIPEGLIVGRRGVGVGEVARRYGVEGAGESSSPPLRLVIPASDARSTMPSVRSSSEFSESFDDLQVGRRVQHPVFGEGVIQSREGSVDNPRLTIHFRRLGSKKLMARYAGLELVYS